MSLHAERDGRPVPGEGIEPSRAEAHGFLRPARLPIPPSRPGRTSVPARALLTGVCVVVMAVACSRPAAPPERPRIAFLFDGSWGEADEVTGPALAGLRFAVLETGDPETVQPLNLGNPDTPEILGEVVADPSVVATVVAPWTTPPAGTVELLAGAGMPVVSLSWAWGAPAEDVPWVALAPDLRAEAELLIAAGSAVAAGGRCVAGDTHPTSGPLADAVAAAARSAGPVERAGIVDAERPASAAAVAGRLRDAGCEVVLWTGGADDLELLLDAAPELDTVVGTSRVKTEGGIGLGVTHPARRLLATCPCADISLTRTPELQRFIHDFQSESGGASGPFAIEAYDAGRWLLRVGADGRAAVAAAVAGAGAVDGLLGTYRIAQDGALLSSPAPPRVWRALGSRWLPVGGALRPTVGASALPLTSVVVRVRPKERHRGAQTVHRTGEET